MELRYSSHLKWEEFVKEVLLSRIFAFRKENREKISILLTGGRSAKKLYSTFGTQKEFLSPDLFYFFGDERCVDPLSKESNYNLARKEFLKDHLKENVFRIKGESKNLVLEAERYSAIIPTSPEIVLLSLGEDEHIASLFPGTKSLIEQEKKVILVNHPIYGKRITITKKILKNAKNTFLLVRGALKGKLINDYLTRKKTAQTTPLSLLGETTTILDKEAISQIQF